MKQQTTRLGKRSLASLKAMVLLALVALAPFGAWAQSDAEGYPMETVRWDKIPVENREVIEQLFADMILVPEGGGVKKFYISTHEVQQNLWVALMRSADAETYQEVFTGTGNFDGFGDSSSGGGGRQMPHYDVSGGRVKDTASVADIQTFISLLRKQTGKRFRLPTEAERLLAAQSQLIDTIADATDSIGKGFHLALDTIAKAERKMLVITATDGTQSKYLLDEMPRVNIEKPYLVITAGMSSISLPLEKLQHMHYEKATEEATAIGEIKAFDEKDSRDRIDFSNLPADANVSIYTLDGKQLYNFRPSQGRSLSLPLNSLQSGIYLVKVNDVTYKIQKP